MAGEEELLKGGVGEAEGVLGGIGSEEESGGAEIGIEDVCRNVTWRSGLRSSGSVEEGVSRRPPFQAPRALSARWRQVLHMSCLCSG